MAGVTVNIVSKTRNLKFDKICRACLEVKRDMRPLFEQLTATMLMGISKVEKDKALLNMACADNYMQYMEVPLNNPSQILEGFFTPTLDQPETQAEPETEQEEKASII
ncbi:Uncharacterized protein OBRU01_05226 [Operophtera brumata]|uniref:Uncharacterized protein n=1 Tax=Operophtera brumata TaxID=104452 RepID=A0A0L7L519_OPEBR|nr:Uncharacterized protein OBRU01_05226 [Operophtera brumata]